MTLAIAVLCWDQLWQALMESVDEARDEEDRAALVLSLSCRNYHILSVSLIVCGQLGLDSTCIVAVLTSQLFHFHNVHNTPVYPHIIIQPMVCGVLYWTTWCPSTHW